jgi:hypothetical protein
MGSVILPPVRSEKINIIYLQQRITNKTIDKMNYLWYAGEAVLQLVEVVSEVSFTTYEVCIYTCIS